MTAAQHEYAADRSATETLARSLEALRCIQHLKEAALMSEQDHERCVRAMMRWQTISGAPAADAGGVPVPHAFMASPARQLFLAHLDAADKAAGNTQSGQAPPATDIGHGGSLPPTMEQNVGMPWVPMPVITSILGSGASAVAPVSSVPVGLRSSGWTLHAPTTSPASVSMMLPNTSAPASPGGLSSSSTAAAGIPAVCNAFRNRHALISTMVQRASLRCSGKRPVQRLGSYLR